MKKLLGWLIFIPFAVMVSFLAVANRTGVTLDAWPLPFSYELPLYVLILGSVLVGIFWGGLGAWWAAGKARRKARVMTWRFEAAEREIRDLEKQVSSLKEDLAQAKAQTMVADGSAALARPKALTLPRSDTAA